MNPEGLYCYQILEWGNGEELRGVGEGELCRKGCLAEAIFHRGW